MESASWYDATAFCYFFTQQERAVGRIPANCEYRLPTEAEWEYACRAGTSTRFSSGDDPGYTNLTNYAWYGDTFGNATHPVGQKLANPWGLCDMHGNVSEWCQNWGSSNLPGGIALDPQGPATGSYRVVRGAWESWYANGCRSASRLISAPDVRFYIFGFRVVLAPGHP